MKPRVFQLGGTIPGRDANYSTLVELLRDQAERLPSQVAYTVLRDGVNEGGSLTYSGLSRKAKAIAIRLQQMKLTGERAMLLYPPGLDFLGAFFGCLRAGVVAVPAFPPRSNRKSERLGAIIEDARAAAALTVSAAKKRIETYLSSTYGTMAIPIESTDEIPDELGTELEGVSPGPDDLAYLQYTSGSTASPKGVMITHQNVLSNLGYIDEDFEHGPESVSLTWLPHFHDMGLVDGLLMPLYGGFRGLLMPPALFLQRPVLWLEAIAKYKVTHSGGPSFAYDLCVRKTTGDQRAGLNLQSWAVAYNGAEPVRRDVLERFAEAFEASGFRRSAFYPAYGLAEATLKVAGGGKSDPPVYCAVVRDALERNQVIVTTDDAQDARHLVSCGRVGGGVEVLIVDPKTDVECEPATIGEIWVTGPGVAKGFWNRPAESARVFHAFTADTHKGPCLRTGDLGFIRKNELYVTGRLKDLIIVRGRNIYPQDIETTAGESHPLLRPGGGAAFSIDDGHQERVVLVHEIETRKAEHIDEIVAAIRGAVSEIHEVQLQSILLIRPASLPRTSSGKAQRKACREMFLARQLEPVAEWSLDENRIDEVRGIGIEYEGDERQDVALLLRELISDKLRLPAAQISVDDPLYRYGLDSLASIEIAHSIETSLGVSISMADLLADKSITMLSADIADRRGSTATRSEPGQGRGESGYALSRGQQAIWFIHQMDPQSDAYNIAVAFWIASNLNIDHLRHAFQLLVDRHESLRTTFKDADQVARQRVSQRAAVAFVLWDAAEWSDELLNRKIEEESCRPFDLTNGPVFRVGLYRKAPDLHALIIAVHHIVADFWSLSVLIDELGKLYATECLPAPGWLPDPTASYADYVAREERMLTSAGGEDHWRHWKEQLKGDLPSLSLPLDKERPRVQTYRGSNVPFSIPADQVTKAKSLSATGQTTLFVTLLTIFQVLLCKYSGQEDILIGAPTSGRTSFDLAGVVGYFVNPVVIRSVIGAAHSFWDALCRTKQTVIEAFYHQEYPFPEIVKRLNAGGDASRSPLFQVMFALQKSHLDPTGALTALSVGQVAGSFQVGQLVLRGFPIQRRIAQFDLTLAAAEGGNVVKASLEYNTDLFERATIERMGAHFVALLQRLVSNPFAPVGRVSYITDSERDQVLAEWGDNSCKLHDFVPIHRIFEGLASSNTDAVAIVDGESVLTYGELDSRSKQLSGYLGSLGVRQETCVALLMHRSAEMVVALMGVLKSGGAYVPIDPSTPARRINEIIREVNPGVLLTHSALAPLAWDSEVESFQLDSDWPRLEDRPVPETGCDVDGDAICYIIHTSGSSGVPKGVAVRHLSLAQYIRAARSHYGVTRNERVLQCASLSFDASADEIYGTLTSGATLVIGADLATVSPAMLVTACRERMITILPLPTAYWHAAVSTLSPAEWTSASSVRLIVIGGESALPERMDKWVNLAGRKLRLVNSYGPTETTIGVTFWSPDGSGSSARVSIGRPIDGSVIRTLDIHGQQAGTGVIGEICIGGAGVARGYSYDPGNTAESFVPDEFSDRGGSRLYRSGDLGRFAANGSLQCLGRMDRQVKVRGYRVELQEVESALALLPEVRETAVAQVGDERGNKRLTAYVALNQGAAPNPDALRDSLRENVPEFMIPGHFVFLDDLPRNSAGKIDRRSLLHTRLELAPARPSERPLNSGVEQQVAEIWSRVLGVASVGCNDNFFDLGGDSILSLQVAALARECGIEVTPKQVFENPTVAALAASASRAATAAAEQISIAGPLPLTPVQRWFFERSFNNAHHWNMAMILDVRRKLDFAVIASAWSSVAARHSTLRSTFTVEDRSWCQNLGAGAAPVIRAVELSGLSQTEEASAIGAAIASEQAGLNLAAGPLLRSILFKRDAGKRDRLLVVAHHLIADAISLRILIAEIDQSCSALIEGPAKSLVQRRPAPAPSLWAMELERVVASDELRVELEHWRQLENAKVSALPVDFRGANIEATAATVEIRLDVEQTSELIRGAREAYRAGVDEMLLAALAETLCDWTASEAVLIEVERHGREVSGVSLDVSESMGWFTAAFPLAIQLGPPSRRLDTVSRVKDSLRGLPNGGIGFGLLRYMSPDSGVRAEMDALPQPQVSFNYLGNLDLAFGPLRVFDSPDILSQGSRCPGAERVSLLEVDAGIKNKELKVFWRFSTNVFKCESIEHLADSFAARIGLLIERGSSGEGRSLSGSDFPLATLTEYQIQRLAKSGAAIEDIYPLSPSQQGMLFHSIYSDEADVYVGVLTLSINGLLDPDVFEEAWERIVSRHSIFRTSFAWDGLSEPHQIVHREARLSVRRLDWSDAADESIPERLQTLTAEERRKKFALSAAPLMRVTLIRFSEDSHVLAVTVHHLIVDGWSMPLLFGEVFSIYERIRTEPGSLILDRAGSFGSYMGWLRRQDRRAAEDFWRTELKGISASVPLPIQRASAGAPGEMDSRRRLQLSASLTSGLVEFARHNRLTLNSVLQGAWGALLARYSGDTDVLFGAVTAGRPASLPGSERIIGPLSVTLPTRARPSRKKSLGIWLQELQGRQTEARRFEYSSLIDIQSWSDVARGRRLFDSIIAFENYPFDRGGIGASAGLRVELLDSLESTNYPLTVIIFPGDRLSIEILYRSHQFEDSAIGRLLGHFEALLTGFAKHTNQPVCALPILTEDERKQILGDWSGSETAYPKGATIAHLFRDQVDLRPDSVALVFKDDQVSYGKLCSQAGAAASVLAGYGAGPETVVGISVERSIETIVGVVAIVHSGAAYLPVDLSYPEERIRFMFADSGAKLALTFAPITATQRHSPIEILPLGERLDRSMAPLAADENVRSQSLGAQQTDPENLAYVMYTSGSTGTPKGVGITNRGVVRLVKETNYFDFGEEEVFLQLSGLSFDASTFEIWGALLNGAKLVIMPPETPGPAQIASVLKEQQVTAAWFTAGLFHLLAQDRPEAFSSVTHVLAGGDVVGVDDARALAIHAPGVTLTNGYGPTESTTFTTSYKSPRAALDAAVLPIGRPISNTFVHIMDEDLNAMPQGVPGELFIAGAGLARCYIGAPALTAERFLPNPVGRVIGERLYRSGDIGTFQSDGNIQFLGRRDRQVKIRGFRVEPEEIESAISAHPQVRQCAVAPWSEGTGEKRLIAYVAARARTKIEAVQIQGFLRARLPGYMIPAGFVILDSLPLTPTGKIDRQALPARDAIQSAPPASYVAPRDAVEEVLAGIWQEVLSRERVGITDDFFALGGHSLAAMRVTSSIRYIFNFDLAVNDVFESATIELLARAIRAAETEPGEMERIASVVQRIKGMSPAEKAEALRARSRQSL